MTLIAVDAREAFRPNRRGMGNVLVATLRALAGVRPDWRFRLFHRLDTPDPFADLPQFSHHRIDIPAADRLDLWERVRLPAAAALSRADLLFCPANTGPGWAPMPRAVTMHDLIPLEIDPGSDDTRRWLRGATRAARGAAVVFTASEYTRGRIVERFGVPAERVAVVRWATDLKREADPARVAAAKAKYGLAAGERYAFGFAAADPRKNTRRLLAAFAGVPGDVRLLLVGTQGPALDEYRALADPRVLLHGYADGADLPPLLSGADCLCFPSRSEGFGLPVLDGFAAGTAVLCGDRTSLPEVAGDAAVLVDPDSTDSIREGLARLLSDDAFRAELVGKGTERVGQFTWTAAAEVLATGFERAMGL
jgi:alpha-1,3-rhamnosyl/mannosyltransferase